MNLINIFTNGAMVLIKRNYCDRSSYIRKIRKVSKSQLIWYPGHINKGIEQLNRKVSVSDAVIEVHDSRIPITGRTDLINSFGQVKPKILLLNKVDLIGEAFKDRIKNRLQNTESNHDAADILFTQLNDYDSQYKTFQRIHDRLLAQLDTGPSARSESRVLVTGIPNVGKSTFINGLRNWSAHKFPLTKRRSSKPAAVGPHAGVTRTVSEKILVSEGPPRLYVLDSPGIWEPANQDVEAVLKLALCGCLNFDSLFKELVVDYMLYWLNSRGLHDYVGHYQLPGPTDDVVEFARGVCASRGLVTRATRAFFDQAFAPQVTAAFDLVFKDFGRGLLGKVVLDDLDDSGDPKLTSGGISLLPLGTILGGNRARTKTPFPFVWGSE